MPRDAAVGLLGDRLRADPHPCEAPESPLPVTPAARCQLQIRLPPEPVTAGVPLLTMQGASIFNASRRAAPS